MRIRAHSKRLARLSAWLHTRTGRWVGMLLLFGLLVALFHPLFILLGGVIGAVTMGIAVVGGFVLGRRNGVLYALLTSLLSIPLWSREYGFEWTENISGPIIAMTLAYGGGWVEMVLRRMREQAASLLRANEALKETQLRLLQVEKLVLFGEIAAGVAHELNQPLAIISLVAQLGQQRLRDGKAEGLGKELERIHEQVQRAGQIIRRLKSTGRSDGPAERCDASLNDIVRNVVQQFQPQYDALGIALDVQLAPALAPLHCNATEMEQMLACLLLNARDAVNDREDKRVVIRTLDADGRLGLEVEDTGVGMTRDVVQRIFDPFFTTKEIGAGSGLGLPICHRVVTDHGGSIDVTSTQGMGSRFSILLPASQPADKPVSDAAPAPAGLDADRLARV